MRHNIGHSTLCVIRHDLTKDGNDWFWDQDYILPNSLTTEKFTNPTKSLWWFRFGHYGNIGCVVSGSRMQN